MMERSPKESRDELVELKKVRKISPAKCRRYSSIYTRRMIPRMVLTTTETAARRAMMTTNEERLQRGKQFAQEQQIDVDRSKELL
jgi:hypothetical protein